MGEPRTEARPLAPVLRLVPRARGTPEATAAVSLATVRALEAALDMARRGEVVGMTGAFAKPGRRFFVEITGEAQRDPTFALGMASMVCNELAAMVAEPRA